MKHQKISETELSGIVTDICRQIVLSKWQPDYIVGIVRGGLVPAVMISQFLNVPMYALKISLRDGIEDCESNCWMSEHAFEGKKILVVDDINDTGATLNWLVKDWQGSAFSTSSEWDNIWGNNVRFATVVDNRSSQSKYKIDYVGLVINKFEEDTWIDFPWEGWWK